jgi:uncharacterized protein
MSEQQSFLGRGWSFPVRFSSSFTAGMSEDEQDIHESLIILLETHKGERVMRPSYGTNLHQNIFDSLKSSTAARVTEDIRRAILFHEPRVIPEEVRLTSDEEEGRILIEIEYTIIQTNTRINLVYPFYLTEATDIR